MMPGNRNFDAMSAPNMFTDLEKFAFKPYQPTNITLSSCSSSSSSPFHSYSEATSRERVVPETPESQRPTSSTNSSQSGNAVSKYREDSNSPTPGFSRKIVKSEPPRKAPSLNSTLSHSGDTSQKAAMDEYEVFCEKEQCLKEFLRRIPSADIMEAQDILVTTKWNLEKAIEIASKMQFKTEKKNSKSTLPKKGVVFGNSVLNGKAAMSEEIVLNSDDEDFVAVPPVQRSHNVQSTSAKKRRRVVVIDDSDDDSCEIQEAQSTKHSHSSNFSVLNYQPPGSNLLLQQAHTPAKPCSAATYSKLTPRQTNHSVTDGSIFTDDTSSALIVPRKQKPVKRNQPKVKAVKKKRHRCDTDDEDFSEEYGNDDVYDSEDSDAGEHLTPARSKVLTFFQNGTAEELLTIPGCSKKKAELILKYRPFENWSDLVLKLSNDKYLSGELLNGAKKVLDMKTTVSRLMNRCQRISLEMGDLVEALKENRANIENYVCKQPDLLNPKLRLTPYQMLGLNWLMLMRQQEVNAILADEMGLGKTVQAIAFLAYLHQLNVPGPHLIVAPSSTLDNWQNEFQAWWPSASIICYHGSQENRRELRMQIINDEVEEFDIMVTTYNMVASSAEDRGFFKKLEFNYVVFDEAHMLKNMSSQRYQHLMKVKATRRLLLTGTPLQNNLVELMSLLIFAMPNMFSGKTEQIRLMFSAVGKSDVGKSKFERERIEHAKRIMKPFVLRRLKSEVLKDLPTKHEEIRLCQMTESQRKLYSDLVVVLSEEVRKKEESDITTSGAGMMMQLRKMANHPLLLRNCYDDAKLMKMAKLMIEEPTHSEANPDYIFEDMCVMSDFELHRLCKEYKVLKPFILDDNEILNSGKFVVFDQLLPDMLLRGCRILIFSQFTMVLDIIEAYLHIRKLEYLRLDGQVPVSERQQLIDEFNSNNSIPVFLLSTRAGGLGINLTSADTVVIHDIDFNPYNDKQAEDRCHRVGQQKDVTVIRMISEDTIEEGMLQRAKEKLKLEQDVTSINADEEKDSASVAKLLRDALGISVSKN